MFSWDLLRVLAVEGRALCVCGGADFFRVGVCAKRCWRFGTHSHTQHTRTLQERVTPNVTTYILLVFSLTLSRSSTPTTRSQAQLAFSSIKNTSQLCARVCVGLREFGRLACAQARDAEGAEEENDNEDCNFVQLKVVFTPCDEWNFRGSL